MWTDEERKRQRERDEQDAKRRRDQQQREADERNRNLISPLQGALWDGQIINTDNNPFTPW